MDIQAWAEKLTRRWWFYLLILIILFLPSYSARPVNPQDTPKLVQQVLTNPYIYRFQWLFVFSKLLTIALVIVVLFAGKLATQFRIVSSFGGIVFLTIAIFQNIAKTSEYGFAVLIGNLVVMAIVAFYWILELVVNKNDFTHKTRLRLNWWVILMAFFAFWYPVNTKTTVPVPDFSPFYLLNNESVLTFCMFTPVILALVIAFYPSVNIATLRVTGFVGFLIGLLNMISWFVINPLAWWMGVLHFPLVSISFYVLILSFRHTPAQVL